MLRTRVFAVVAMACMGLASCSDGDGDRLSRAELAKRGDAVCQKLDADVKKLASQFDASLIFPPEQMQELYTKMVPLVDEAIASFRSLEPPKELEAKYAAAMTQMTKDRETLVASTKSPEAAKKLYDGQVDPFAGTTELLAEVGITACSDDGAQGDAGEGDETATTTTAP